MVINESINPNKLWCKSRKRLSQALCCVSSLSPLVPLSLYYFQHLNASLVIFFPQKNQVSVTHRDLDLHHGFKCQRDPH